MATDVSTDDLALLRRFEPILRFNEGELFFPASVEQYVRCCELLDRGPDGKSRVLVAKGDLTVERLVELGGASPRPGQFLRFVDRPLGRAEVARWRLRADRPRFHNASRLARVGVLSRVVDALNRASLMFRGKVASGTEAAAEVQYREGMDPNHHPYYGRVVRDGGYTVVQYWFFYVFNDWRSRVYGVNDHEADWEQVTIYLVEAADGSLTPSWVVFSAHDEVGDDLRRRWDDPDLTKVDDHPVVFPGLGSHSGAYLAGEYLTTFDTNAFRRLFRVSRALSRALLPWTRHRAHAGIGIPYIDYSRGDGRGIGPGERHQWVATMIDETTDWVVHYRGLWGNDTEDPFGGERGPAGPRYERSTSVRASWGDPVGWSGLRKVAPDRQREEQALVDRLAELDGIVADLETGIARQQTALRAEVAGGETVTPAAEAALLSLSAQRVAALDERLLLERRRTTPARPAGPHDHLHHRRLPLPDEEKTRRRFLSVWSAVSTSVVLVALALLMVPGGFSAGGVGLVAIGGLFVLEAVARKELVRFALTAVIVFVVASVVLTIVLALLVDWRLAVGALLLVSALLLLIVNLRELVRD